jgi:hypothetical protein
MLTRALMMVVPALLGIAALAFFILRRNRASRWLLFYAAVGLGLGFLGYRGIVRQIEGHRCITTLDPSRISSITILGKPFDDSDSLNSIATALRSSTWFIPSHTSISVHGDFEIHTKTGQVVQYQIGFINGGKAVLIHDSGFTFQDVNENLPQTLEQLRH